MNDLQHWGILGMHWGKRKSTSEPDTSSSDHKVARELRKKKITELSNDDIRKITTRLQLEKQLKDLDAGDSKRGRELVSKFLNSPVGKIAIGFLFKKVKDVINKRRGYSNPDDVSSDIIDAVLLEDHN